MNIASIVEKKLEQDAGQADRILENLRSAKRPIENTGVATFFPEFVDRSGTSETQPYWSEGGRDLTTIQQILLLPPPILALHPMSRRDFELRTQMTVESARTLAENGYLHWNLYIRNPEEWRKIPESAELLPLIEVSVAIGERIDKYFEARAPGFDSNRKAHAGVLSNALDRLHHDNPTLAAELCSDLKTNRRDFPFVAGTRWAYLDAIGAAEAQQVASCVGQGELKAALEITRLTKHRLVSPITAAVGGEFYWEKKNHELLRQRYLGDASSTQTTSPAGAADDFLVYKACSKRPTQLMTNVSAIDLVKYFRGCNLRADKRALMECRSHIAGMLANNEDASSAIEELSALELAIERTLETWKKVAAVSGFLAEVTIGAIVPRLFGDDSASKAITGATVGGAVGAIMHKKIENFGEYAYSLWNPKNHRFLQLLGDGRLSRK